MRLCFIVYYSSGPFSDLTHLWLLSPVKYPLGSGFIKTYFLHCIEKVYCDCNFSCAVFAAEPGLVNKDVKLYFLIS